MRSQIVIWLGAIKVLSKRLIFRRNLKEGDVMPLLVDSGSLQKLKTDKRCRREGKMNQIWYRWWTKAIGGDLQEGRSQVSALTFLRRKSLKIGKEAQNCNKASQ